ncbi:heat shock protein 9/12-domain-containing protein [Russula compacta]|nr:heat shock protein 9/12-domain-containing protein [Russula compacta]
MSDQGRQSFTDKAAAALKPDSEKSTPEHVSDKIKGTADTVASEIQPESQKSTGQEVGDTFSGGRKENDASLLDKAKNAVGLGDRNIN